MRHTQTAKIIPLKVRKPNIFRIYQSTWKSKLAPVSLPRRTYSCALSGTSRLRQLIWTMPVGTVLTLVNERTGKECYALHHSADKGVRWVG